jgi:hypothetical protein
MSIEIGNSLHAMASVKTLVPAGFIGQGNVGFAAFGSSPELSERVATGQIRLRLLQGLNFAAGEGQIFVTPLLATSAFPLPTGIEIEVSALPPDPSGQDILVELRQIPAAGSPPGTLSDIQFMVVIFRYPQQSTA